MILMIWQSDFQINTNSNIMGTSYNYKCDKCNYSVQTSGGFDFGMLAVTDTYICTQCKEIVDVSVGVYGEKLSLEESQKKQIELQLQMDFYKCPKCGSYKHLILWDTKKKPCPKCKGRLKKDDFGVEVMWD